MILEKEVQKVIVQKAWESFLICFYFRKTLLESFFFEDVPFGFIDKIFSLFQFLFFRMFCWMWDAVPFLDNQKILPSIVLQ